MKFVAVCTPEERFARQTAYAGDCIVWTGRISKLGYGQFCFENRMMPAHRYAYEAAKGPIPEGHHIDHLCCNRPCVNAAHLEAVLPSINVRRRSDRQMTCPNGHALTTENVFIKDNGRRRCRICRRGHQRRWLAKQQKERR